jgi:methylmalonyl-CoA mutase, C-terminal domain
MMNENKVRVLMAKPGVDGHYRGIYLISNALRKAGFEVVYGGNMSPREIASTAVAEDVNVVGLSILTGDVKEWVSETTRELKEQGKANVLLLLGGVISEDDTPKLRAMGVHGIFRATASLNEIVDFVREHASVENGA